MSAARWALVCIAVATWSIGVPTWQTRVAANEVAPRTARENGDGRRRAFTGRTTFASPTSAPGLRHLQGPSVGNRLHSSRYGPSSVSGEAQPVYTICTLLVGSRAGQSTGVRGVFSTSFKALTPEQAIRTGEDLLSLQENLRSAFNLDRAEVVASLGDWMTVGRELVLESPGRDVRLTVKTTGFSSEPPGPPTGPPMGGSGRAMLPASRYVSFETRLTAGGGVVFERPRTVAVGHRDVFARQAETNGPMYFVVIAVPSPETRMGTSVGIEAAAGRTAATTGGSGGAVSTTYSARSDGASVVGTTVMSGRIRAPKLLFSTYPSTPAAARAAGITGVVILSGTIAADGSVTDVRVIKGVDGLTDAAVAAFRQWRYQPPTDPGGKPAHVQVSVTFGFED